MKVAILTPFFPASILSEQEVKKHKLKVGHPYTWIKNLAEGLTRIQNLEVHVVTMCNEFETDREFQKNGVYYNFIKPGNKYLRILSFYESDRKRIFKFLRKYQFDIVHGQGMNMYGYFAVSSKLPNLITHHLFDEQPLRSFFKYEKKSVINVYNTLLHLYHQKVIMSKSRYIISITPFIRKALEQKNKGYTIVDIGNAIALSFFQNKPDVDEGFMLFIGSICDRKSVLELLEAIKMAGNMSLKIVSGTTGGTYFKKVKDYISNHNLTERIEFVGELNNNEMINILNRCSSVVLPSKKEGAPMVISEAFAAGKPVIASNVDGIPYMVDENKNGLLFEVGDTKMLAHQIKVLMERKDLRDDMKICAKELAQKTWHPDVVAQNTFNFYKTILKESN